MIFYISDLHLFCKSQTKEGVNYDSRPFETTEEMHDYILTRWNARITNADTVYILGDIALRGSNGPLIGLVSQLRGKKVLVRGNHDDVRDYRYAQLFDEIVHYAELIENVNGKPYKLVLCHYPILMWKDQHRGAILLYGHTHNSVEDTFFQDCIRRMNESEEPSLRRHGGQPIRAINVGACMPWINYTPRTIKELLSAQEQSK
jgi:calcineurin-like phosphoesterase family protein